MLARELTEPRSIAVIGGSDNLQKPGGRLLRNILEGSYSGGLYVVNPARSEVQGVKSWPSVSELPDTELAILAIPAAFCLDAVKQLAENKQTRAFIILSAGFAEEGRDGALLEQAIAEAVNRVEGTLIGPNCIGVINRHYQGVFTAPVPDVDPRGCDFISGSGATAVFIMEAGIPRGLRFSSVWSVGNGAQTGAEEVLAHMDESFDPATSSRVKLLYLENIDKPDLLLRSARSLIRKGCRIAAVKAGTSEAGSRAASSHTGALASPDMAVDALFRKAGIVRCHSRSELVTVASVFMHKPLKGPRLAVITHAGGPAVMLTDALSEGGLEVPRITHPRAAELLVQLHPGSSVSNPLDFLATGNAGQLGLIMDYCDRYFDQVDGMVVIFGSPGLFPVDDVYEVLHEKMNTCSKPVFPVLPSVVNAGREIGEFIRGGRIYFPDEVMLGRALAKVYHLPEPQLEEMSGEPVRVSIPRSITRAGPGYLSPGETGKLLDAAGIPRVREAVAGSIGQAKRIARDLGYPVAMKVVGPLHKSDVGGVSLNIMDAGRLEEEFDRMMNIPGTDSVLLQEMVGGTELFAGVRKEDRFGHLVVCGPGGIFVEVTGDVSACLAPVDRKQASAMIRELKTFPVLLGTRGQEGIDIALFADILVRLSELVRVMPGITEMDLNPLMAGSGRITAVDARVRVG